MIFFKHQSTAEKIIYAVEQKISVILRKKYLPFFNQLQCRPDFLRIYFSFDAKNRQIKSIGQLLKNLPGPLYTNYQQLGKAEKKEFREEVANKYFEFLKSRSENFANIAFDVSSAYAYRYEICEEMSKILRHQQRLHPPKSPTLKAHFLVSPSHNQFNNYNILLFLSLDKDFAKQHEVALELRNLIPESQLLIASTSNAFQYQNEL